MTLQEKFELLLMILQKLGKISGSYCNSEVTLRLSGAGQGEKRRSFQEAKPDVV
jgi:hypothetical protein